MGVSMKSAKDKTWKADILGLLAQTKEASTRAAQFSATAKKRLLEQIARELEKNSHYLEKENKKDLAAAKQAGLTTAMIDRLTLTPERIKEMADGVKAVAGLPDPVGKVLASWKRPNGLKISKVSVPIGVILIIY